MIGEMSTVAETPSAIVQRVSADYVSIDAVLIRALDIFARLPPSLVSPAFGQSHVAFQQESRA
jgi:hypothetical protein